MAKTFKHLQKQVSDDLETWHDQDGSENPSFFFLGTKGPNSVRLGMYLPIVVRSNDDLVFLTYFMASSVDLILLRPWGNCCHQNLEPKGLSDHALGLYACIKAFIYDHMGLIVRKPAFCICENKDADQLRGNREADQRLCFRYTDSTTPLLPKYKISSL